MAADLSSSPAASPDTLVRCDEAPAWRALQAHYAQTGRGFDLRQAFAEDAGRFAAFSQRAPHLFADVSKGWIDAASQALLCGRWRLTHVHASGSGGQANQESMRGTRGWV